MISEGHLYELGRLPFPDLSSLQASFAALPQDPYAHERLRSRCYSRYRYDGSTLERLSQKDFMQSSEINNYVGDVERSYEDIDINLCQNKIFIHLFKEFQARTALGHEDVIEAHQIRWHCKRKIKEPAPEGMHQDGFDYIAMFMINTYNLDGGDIMLYMDKEAAPCFRKRLEPGEFVVLNDKKMFHNAAPLVPTANEEDGHWDLIVLTANKTAD